MKKGLPGEYSPWMIATMEQFNRTVQQGKVQYFEWDSREGKPILRYTKEELQYLRNTGAGSDAIFYNEKEYFQNDIVFKKKYVDAISDGYIIGHLISVLRQPFIGELCNFSFFGKRDIMGKYHALLQTALQGTLFGSSSFLHFGENNINCLLPMGAVMSDKIISEGTSYMLIDTCMSEKYLRGTLRSTKAIEAAMAPRESIESVINHLNSINRGVRDRL